MESSGYSSRALGPVSRTLRRQIILTYESTFVKEGQPPPVKNNTLSRLRLSHVGMDQGDVKRRDHNHRGHLQRVNGSSPPSTSFQDWRKRARGHPK